MPLSLRQLADLKRVFQQVLEEDTNPRNIIELFLRDRTQVTDAQLEIAAAYQSGLLPVEVREQIDELVTELLRAPKLYREAPGDN